MRRAAAALMLAALAGNASGYTSSVNVMNKVSIPRAQAVGGAGVAIGGDPAMVWINPAAAAHKDIPYLTLSGQRGFFGETTGQVLWTTPFARGNLTAGALYYDAGTAQFNTSLGESLSYALQQDVLGAMGYAAPLAADLAVGGTFKALHSQLLDQSSMAVAVDVGVNFRINDKVKAGLSAMNLGSKLHYLDDVVSLPTVVRFGVVTGGYLSDYNVRGISPRDALMFTADVEYRLMDAATSWRGGAEYRWNGMLCLRAGARLGSQKELSTFSGGVGIRLKQFRLDYSTRFGGIFYQPQSLSITFAIPSTSQPVTGSQPLSVPAEPGAEIQPTPPLRKTIAPVGDAAQKKEEVAKEDVRDSEEETKTDVQEETDMKEEKSDGQGKDLTDDMNRRLDELLDQEPSSK